MAAVIVFPKPGWDEKWNEMEKRARDAGSAADKPLISLQTRELRRMDIL
jgi:hypothetical protein